MTIPEMIEVLTLLESAGIKPPWDAKEAGPAKAAMAKTYAALLGDVSSAEVQTAAMGYARAPVPFWPSVGQLLAALPSRQLAAIDDSEEAWVETKTWCDRNAYRTPQAGELDRDHEDRDAAMRLALQAVGGAKGWGQTPTPQEPFVARRFRESYQVHRKRGAVTSEARLLESAAPRQLRGGGFRRIGDV
jgi:hypothetical protein